MFSSLKAVVLVIVITIVLFVVVDFEVIQKDKINIMSEQIIRFPLVAGSFYPRDNKNLKTQINSFLTRASVSKLKNLRALIVPHAGIIYSGQTAAYAFKELEAISKKDQDIKRVILIGPAHHEYLSKFGLSHADIWETPLGQVPVNKDLVNKLEQNPEFIFADSALNQEHSLEVQLPFLQMVLKNNWQLIPIIAGQVDDFEIQSAAKVISKLMDDHTILVISTDLSHYHSKLEANEIDQKCLDSITKLQFNPQCEACGAIPLKLLFAVAQSLNWQAEILNYSDSGDLSGEKEVVGYVSAVLTGKANPVSATKNNEYTLEEHNYLLNLARNTIKYAFENNGRLLPVSADSIPLKLKEKRGVFVTLYKNDKLRGCIGYIQPVEEIYKAVQNNALSAAFNDSRFDVLSASELAECKIEISILSVPQLTSLLEIRENIDGVVLKQDAYQATYLPQVWQDISGPAEFYGSLCLKAGLQADCYTDPETEFYKYQAEVFTE